MNVKNNIISALVNFDGVVLSNKAVLTEKELKKIESYIEKIRKVLEK